MGATLKLYLTNAAGGDLTERVQVDLFSMESSLHLQTTYDVSGELTIGDIPAAPAATFRLMVTPTNHRIVQIFVFLRDGITTEAHLVTPVAPEKVVALSAPSYGQLAAAASRILEESQYPSSLAGGSGFLQGSDLYDALSLTPLLQACFLNIVAKAAATPLPSGGSCLDRFGGLLQIAQDRLFLRTTAALWEEVQSSPAFHSVPSTLHQPRPEYHLVASYKTADLYGNLQLTFQRRGETGNDYVVDVDIDDAQGIQHLFQVLRNAVSGPTNPYDIHDILLRQQPPVDPRYSFLFAAAVSRAA
jgi:hypothetical protein